MVAIWVEGTTRSWVNVVLQDVAASCRPMFYTWAQFKDAMVQGFELVTKTEEVQKQLRALRQTGQVVGYVPKF